MLNTSIHSTKTYKKEDELVGKEHRDATIRIENVYGDPCELFKNDNITIIRKNGKKDDCVYYGECIRYSEFGHWYFTACVHNPNDYCNVYTKAGSLKYLEVLPFSKWEVTHIAEDKIEKIIRRSANPKRMIDIQPVKYRQEYNDEYDYVLCTRYGTNGLTPTLSNCNGGCLSSSGDSACSGYFGEEKIPNTNLYVVTCANNLECIKGEYNNDRKRD